MRGNVDHFELGGDGLSETALVGWALDPGNAPGRSQQCQRQTGLAADKEEARKEAILRLKGFPVVGSMENPPTNPVAVAQARGGQD